MRNDLCNVTQVKEKAVTDLEMQEKAYSVLLWMKDKIELQKRQIEEQEKKIEGDKPKIESFYALMRSEKNMSITDASKHFELHPKLQVFPWLRTHKYLTDNDLPTQKAIDENILRLRQTVVEGNVYFQAVVETGQLDTWRLNIVNKIKEALPLDK